MTLTGQKPVSVPFCPPKDTHGVAWEWNRASAVTAGIVPRELRWGPKLKENVVEVTAICGWKVRDRNGGEWVWGFVNKQTTAERPWKCNELCMWESQFVALSCFHCCPPARQRSVFAFHCILKYSHVFSFHLSYPTATQFLLILFSYSYSQAFRSGSIPFPVPP